MVRRIINESAKQLAGQENIDDVQKEIQDRLEDIEEKYGEVTGVSPEEFYHCVYPPIELDCEQKIELTLKNIGKYKFIKEEGDWKLEKKEKHRL